MQNEMGVDGDCEHNNVVGIPGDLRSNSMIWEKYLISGNIHKTCLVFRKSSQIITVMRGIPECVITVTGES